MTQRGKAGFRNRWSSSRTTAGSGSLAVHGDSNEEDAHRRPGSGCPVWLREGRHADARARAKRHRRGEQWELRLTSGDAQAVFEELHLDLATTMVGTWNIVNKNIESEHLATGRVQISAGGTFALQAGSFAAIGEGSAGGCNHTAGSETYELLTPRLLVFRHANGSANNSVILPSSSSSATPSPSWARAVVDSLGFSACRFSRACWQATRGPESRRASASRTPRVTATTGRPAPAEAARGPQRAHRRGPRVGVGASGAA